MVRKVFTWAMMALACLPANVAVVRAHELPARLPEPLTVEEAWNVINECTANVDELLKLELVTDIQFQIANAGAAAAFLRSHPADAKDAPRIDSRVDVLLESSRAMVAACGQSGTAISAIRERWGDHRRIIESLKSYYPEKCRSAAVYICPMHPGDRHLKRDESCSVCGMGLVPRHLPGSGIYSAPGAPSLKMEVVAAPLVIGKSNALKIRLARRDGLPVLPGDLLVMHTQRIHLLINDESLTDYHHEHPKPTSVPGEYEFSFTPRRGGAYRIWADVVPAATGVQEYVVTNAPADTLPAEITDRRTVMKAVVGGRTFELDLNDGKPIRAGVVVVGTIAITEADGTPCSALEPVMEAFAHIVGFSEDRHTVLHIHPYGKSPAGPADRAGPAFAFKLYAPTHGFLRLYVQVQIGGTSQFVPFGVTILPAESVPTEKTLKTGNSSSPENFISCSGPPR